MSKQSTQLKSMHVKIGKMKLEPKLKAAILGWLNMQLALERQKRYFKGGYK